MTLVANMLCVNNCGGTVALTTGKTYQVEYGLPYNNYRTYNDRGELADYSPHLFSRHPIKAATWFVGREVWHIRHGKGVVQSVGDVINICYKHGTQPYGTYPCLPDGRESKADVNPSVYAEIPSVYGVQLEKEPFSPTMIGRTVLVSLDGKPIMTGKVVDETATGVHLAGTSYGKGRYTFNEIGVEL